MTEMKYSMEPTTKKPTRAYRKGSKFDSILEAFNKSPHPLVKVEIPGKDANYVRTQLKKRLDALDIKTMTVSVVNSICYLEKEQVKTNKKRRGQDTPADEAPADEAPTDEAPTDEAPQNQE